MPTGEVQGPDLDDLIASERKARYTLLIDGLLDELDDETRAKLLAVLRDPAHFSAAAAGRVLGFACEREIGRGTIDKWREADRRAHPDEQVTASRSVAAKARDRSR